MAFGNQKYSGPWADFAAAATNSNNARNSAPPAPVVHCGVPRLSSAPQPVGTIEAASNSAPSPTAFAASACRPALSVPGLSRQKEMSRKLEMPTPVQPISSTARLPARTSSAIVATNRSR